MSAWSPESIKTILLIAVPAIGDTLLATPMLSSLKNAYPEAEIDLLVPQECVGILEGNTCIRECIPFKRKSKVHRNGALYRRLFRKYDLAVSNSVGDRYYLYLFLAAARRASLVPEFDISSFWKYCLCDVVAPHDPSIHTVLQNSALIAKMGITPIYDIQAPTCDASIADVLGKIGLSGSFERLVLLHPRPGGAYKEWPKESWALVLRYLDSQGFQAVLSGGPGDKEREYLDTIIELSGVDAINAAGRLRFSELSILLKQAVVFIGTDTSTTHLAASLGAPTLALFGPTSLATWSPWPQNKSGESYVGREGLENVFRDRAGRQRIGNVVVLSEACSCRPYDKVCRKSGSQESECMSLLRVESVIDEITLLLDRSDSKLTS
jgi:heptosyltransferase-3